MAGKKQAPAKIEEEDEPEGWDDAVVDPDKESEADLRMRDWRDVERFREMKELRKLVDDDYGLEEIFHIPVKPRAEPAIPARVAAKAGKALLPEKPGAKVAPNGKAIAAKTIAAKGAQGKVAPVKPAAHAPHAANGAPAKAAHPKDSHIAHKKPAPARLKAKAKRR
jgi:hypothetical protein